MESTRYDFKYKPKLAKLQQVKKRPTYEQIIEQSESKNLMASDEDITKPLE